MKKLIIPIVLAVTLGLTLYNTIYLGRVRNVTTTPTVVQVTTTPLQQARTFTDFLTVNTLELNPVVSPSVLREGVLWNDAVNDALRFMGGDYPGGLEIPRGRYITDVLTFNAGVQDTLEFPELIDLGRVVEYTMVWDSVNSPLVTFTLEEKRAEQHDSTYLTMSSSVFPYTLAQKYDGLEIKYTCDAVDTDNRAIVDWDTASVGTINLYRKVYIIAKD